MRIIMSLFMVVIAVLVLSALTPVMAEMFNFTKASNSFNCVGYEHPTDPSLSYNSSLSGNTSSFGCQISSFAIPIIVLGAIVAFLMFLMYGPSTREESILAYQQ